MSTGESEEFRENCAELTLPALVSPSSFTPLQTECISNLKSEHVGSMEGCFGVAYWNPRDGGASYDLETSKSMEIKINKFNLNAEGVREEETRRRKNSYTVHTGFKLIHGAW